MFDHNGYIQVDPDYVEEKNTENIAPVKYNVSCPRLKSKKLNNNVLNWHTDWCLKRIEYNAGCSITCYIAKQIRKEINDGNSKSTGTRESNQAQEGTKD